MSTFYPIDPGREAWNSGMVQSWEVEEERSASGRRRTLCQQTLPSWTISISYNDLSRAEKDSLLAFFASCKGAFASFFYKFFKGAVEGQTLSQGTDGKYQCLIPIGGFMEAAEEADVTKVYVNNVATTNYTVSGGKITLGSGLSGTVKADYTPYWKVCFENTLSVSQKFHDLYSVSVKLRVVRE